MIEKGMRRVEHSVTEASNLQAEIDVVESYCEIGLIETPYFPEDPRPRHQACARHGANVTDHVGEIEIILLLAIQTFERVSAIIVKAHDHAGVLNTSVGIEKLGAYCSHLG